MKEEKFLSLHSLEWQNLESLCSVMDKKNINNLESSQIKDFLKLFKQTSHHLAYARTHYPNSHTINYLNSLVGKCNTYIYATPKTTLSKNPLSFLVRFPRKVAEYKNYVFLAILIFFLGFATSYLTVYFKPSMAHFFMNDAMVDNISSNSYGAHVSSDMYPFLSSYIMTNNISVCIRSFVFGITLGIGTAYILYFNGLMIGGLAALCDLYGSTAKFYSLILPHGVFELTAIFIAGAAGFIIAKSILIPGNYTRKYSIIVGTKKAFSLLGGIVILLIFAGLIEGFFTPLPIGELPKLLFAALTAAILILYMLIPNLKWKS